MTIPRRRTVATALLLSLAYFATGRLGLSLPALGTSITLIWLPTGIAVAVLLRYGFDCWPGITLGALAVNLALGTPGWVALGIAVGNTLGPVLTALTLRRLRFHPTFNRKRDILLLTGAAIFGMLIPATVGIAMLSVGGTSMENRWTAGLIWWAGDTMGVISAAPLVLTFRRRENREALRHRAEFLIWLSTTIAVTWGVFVLNHGSNGQAWSLAFLPLPLVAWAAFRFGAVGTSFAIIALSVGAAYGTATGQGPFYRANPIEGPIVLWLFMATTAVLGWLITALHVAGVRATDIQRLFEQALSESSVGVLLAGLDRRITYANHGFTRLTGYSEDELLGKTCARLQGPETDTAEVDRLRAALKSDGHFEGEILNYRKDGTSFWNALIVSPVHNEAGAMTGFLAIQRDVSQRKAAERALHQSEEHLRTIVELEPECVKLLSPEGRLLEINPAGLAMIEAHTLEEVRGHPVTKLISPENRPAFEEMHRRVMHGATDRCVFAITGLKGTHRWLETHAVPYRNGRNEIVGVLGITRDITETRAAAAELERSLSTLQLFINTVPAYISFVDAEERYRLVNRRYVEYFGQSAERLIGQRLCDVQPAEAYAEMQPHIRAALTGQTVRYQSHPTGPDGRSYWFDVQYVPRRAEDGTVFGFFVLVFDITENKRAELALRDNRSRLDSILNSMQDVVWSTTPDGQKLLFVSASAEALYGRPAAEFLADPMKWLEAIHPDDRKEAESRFHRVPETSEFNFEYRIIRSDGTVRWVHDRARIVTDASGQPLRLDGIMTDTTERHELLRSLQESQTRLETLVGNLPGMAYRCQNDPSWTMTYVSDGCEALTGYRRDELENNRAIAYAELVHPQDRAELWAKCLAALDARTQCQNEYRILDRHRRERWVSERASGVYAADGTLLCIDGFIQDITESRRAKIEREQLDRKVQETQKLESLGVLAGGIAHDFNNLLTSILGSASIAATELPLGSSVQDCLEQITEASLRAADLCKQMLAYSGRGRFVVQKLDLGQLVEQTAQMLQISISKKAVLRFRLEPGLPPIEVDATQIRQVIMNLVINASEAIGDQSGVISLSTGLTRVDRNYLRGTLMDPDLPEDDYVFLEVSDTGCGMSAATQSKIFDPFFSTKFTGRGLGLAAVLGIVRGHKGALKVYSEIGRGTTFKLLFPAAAGLGETTPPRPTAVAEWHNEGTVLVVDDEETLRSTISRMMRKMGLEPLLATDGREAVKIFLAEPERFALVLLDLTMPHLDGEQTFTELRRIRPDVRVVLMSGFNAQEALVRFNGKGLAGFLQKPFTLATFQSVLQKVLS